MTPKNLNRSLICKKKIAKIWDGGVQIYKKFENCEKKIGELSCREKLGTSAFPPTFRVFFQLRKVTLGFASVLSANVTLTPEDEMQQVVKTIQQRHQVATEHSRK